MIVAAEGVALGQHGRLFEREPSTAHSFSSLLLFTASLVNHRLSFD